MLGIGEPAPHDSLQEWVLSMRYPVFFINITVSVLFHRDDYYFYLDVGFQKPFNSAIAHLSGCSCLYMFIFTYIL